MKKNQRKQIALKMAILEWKALATVLRSAIVDVELVNGFKMQESIKNSVPENISCLLKHINTPEGYNRILIFQGFHCKIN